MSSLPDPNVLLGVTSRDLGRLIATDGRAVASLLLAATGQGDTRAAREAIYAWAYAYLEPRFDQYQSWSTELAAENYSTTRLAAVGADGYAPTVFDRGAGVESFVGWMVRSFDPDAAGHSIEGASAWMLGTMNEGAQLRTIGAYNDTMTGNSLRDPLSVGWIRVAEPGACSFCLMLASRGSYGILYRSEDTANFRAHSPGKNGGGLCRCHALAAWDAGGKVKPLGETPAYAKDSPFAPYASSAAVFLDSAGARGLIAA